MRKTIAATAVGILTIGLLFQAPAAHAVPLVVTDDPGDPSTVLLQVGSLDFWVSSCSLTIAGSTESCDGLTVDPGSVSPTNAAVVIGASSGHILDIPQDQIPLEGNTYDLSLTLDVQTVACTTGVGVCVPSIKSDAVSLTGNGSPASNDQYLTAAETIQLADSSSLPPISAAVGEPPVVASFAPQPYVVVLKDIGDQLSRISSANGPVTIDTVTQNFGLVPEPASVGVFLVSLIALGAARRRGFRVTRRN